VRVVLFWSLLFTHTSQSCHLRVDGVSQFDETGTDTIFDVDGKPHDIDGAHLVVDRSQRNATMRFRHTVWYTDIVVAICPRATTDRKLEGVFAQPVHELDDKVGHNTTVRHHTTVVSADRNANTL